MWRAAAGLIDSSAGSTRSRTALRAMRVSRLVGSSQGWEGRGGAGMSGFATELVSVGCWGGWTTGRQTSRRLPHGKECTGAGKGRLPCHAAPRILTCRPRRAHSAPVCARSTSSRGRTSST
jgi:hypothetical protein